MRIPALPSWVLYVASLELRKFLSYRTNFWVQLMGAIAIELGIAYFLWSAVFDARGTATVGGYSFRAMMLYYVTVPMVDRILRGANWPGAISQDIYDGGLTRYLVYPVPFFAHKLVSQAAFALICAVQLLLATGAFALWLGIPPDTRLTPGSVCLGILTAFLAMGLHFVLSAIFEMVAFWAENVWSLSVMLRASVNLLGGALIPLSLFPDWAQGLLAVLPFRYLVSFPVRTVMGQVHAGEWIHGVAMIGVWTAALSAIAAWIWSRGTRQYTGVGM